MTQVTPIFGFPYPENTDAPDGPSQFHALALSVETALNTTNGNVSAKQPLDADLTALAALAATAGMLARTGAGAFAVRTLTATDGTLTVANGNGASAAPDYSLTTSGLVTAGFAIAAGWTLNTQSYRILGTQIVFLHIQATRTGGLITAPASGNLGDVSVVTIPAACRPNRDIRTIFANGSITCGSAVVGASGVVQVETMLPTSTIANGDVVTVDYSYMLTS